MVKIVVTELDKAKEWSFAKKEITIGRSSNNDLVLSGVRVSRHHCRLVLINENYVISDLGSQNGTMVNGFPILRKIVTPGDVISVGDVEIHFEPGLKDQKTFVSKENDKENKDKLIWRLMKERSNNLRIQDINSAINSEMNLQPLLERIIDSVIELTHAERGFLITVNGDDMEFEAARNFKEVEVDRPDLAISRSIAKKVIEEKQPVIVINAREEKGYKEIQSITNMGLRSVLCVPMKLKGDLIGAVYVDNRLDKGVFSEEDLSVLELFANQAAIAIDNARQMESLKEKNLELTRIKADMEKMNQRLARTVKSQGTELQKARAKLKGAGNKSGVDYQYSGIVGCSKAMTEIFSVLERVIDSDYPVLIHGESGTGKELIASAIHYNSRRADQPFVSENCAALPDTLLESELFGHVRGAFTGAVSNRKGLLEIADKGTLFLDEVGEMSHEMQKKLLRFLQEGEFRPVGGVNPARVDVRIVSASNKNLFEMEKEGAFRRDLYYRLNVLPVNLPPLRDRIEDIPLLIDHFLTIFCEEVGVAKKEIDSKVIDLLCKYAWPGNVRELENEMRRLVTFSTEAINYDLISDQIKASKLDSLSLKSEEEMNLNERVEAIEKHEIMKALIDNNGNKSQASRALGISRFTLQRKIEKYELQT